MEDAEKPLSEAHTGKHTARTESDIAELVRDSIEWLQAAPLDEKRYRNAGAIQVVEESMSVCVMVPLPYFHHTDVEQESLEKVVSSRLPPSVPVTVEVAPSPDERGSDEDIR